MNFRYPFRHIQRNVTELIDESLQELLGDDGVLFVPPHPTPALFHNQPLTKPLNVAYTAVYILLKILKSFILFYFILMRYFFLLLKIFNVLGLPVTQVPLGLGSWGVPVGVQVQEK